MTLAQHDGQGFCALKGTEGGRRSERDSPVTLQFRTFPYSEKWE